MTKIIEAMDYAGIVDSDTLEAIEHTDLSRTYSMGLDAGQSEYAQIDKWINNNLEPVWEFYVDTLETHKGCWPT